MKIYFMRHAESEYNVKKLINTTPEIDVPLTKKGEDQAEEAAGLLAGKKIEIIYCSEFLRTRQTADIIAKSLRVDIKIDKKLNELKAGKKFEGAPTSNYEIKMVNDPLGFKPRGGESWKELNFRVADFVKELKTKKFKAVLVITHERVVQAARALLGNMEELNSAITKIKNCEILEFIDGN